MLISLTDYVTKEEIVINTDVIEVVRLREDFTSVRIKHSLDPIKVKESPSEILNKQNRFNLPGIIDA